MPPEAAQRFLADRIDYERMRSMPCSEAAFKLDRMRELLRQLGNPQQGMPIIHVAGTKGKGSTAAMMAAVLTAAGYRKLGTRYAKEMLSWLGYQASDPK